MAKGRLRTAVAGAALTLLLMSGGVTAAQTTAPPAAGSEVSYKDAQYVQVTLGFPNHEAGVRLIDGQPDGETEPLTEGVGRRSLRGVGGGDRFFYFDVHDTYIKGGLNKVIMTVTYLDRGLTPIYLEYDSYDTLRPESTEEAVARKRIPVISRSNSEAWKTERIELEDARFAGHQPGGADFRIGSPDELTLRNVSVLLVTHQNPQPAIRVVLDGKEVLFDVPPYVDPATNRTLVPMRAIFNAVGITNENIYFDSASRKVIAQKGQTIIVLAIDSAGATVNNIPVMLDQPAVIKEGRTLAPLRFVSEQFGFRVDWNGETRVITLTSIPKTTP